MHWVSVKWFKNLWTCINERKKVTYCSNCGQLGHWHLECPLPPQEWRLSVTQCLHKMSRLSGDVTFLVVAYCQSLVLVHLWLLVQMLMKILQPGLLIVVLHITWLISGIGSLILLIILLANGLCKLFLDNLLGLWSGRHQNWDYPKWHLASRRA